MPAMKFFHDNGPFWSRCIIHIYDYWFWMIMLFFKKTICKQSLTLPEAILIAREGADADKCDTLKVWYDAPHRSVANPTRAQPNVDYRGFGIHSLPADWLDPGDFITTDWQQEAGLSVTRATVCASQCPPQPTESLNCKEFTIIP